MARETADEDREQRIQSIAQRVQAEEPVAEKKPRASTEPENPKIERAKEQLGDLLDDLWEMERTLKLRPVTCALIQSIRRRVNHLAVNLGDV